jgi:hypothetical protein
MYATGDFRSPTNCGVTSALRTLYAAARECRLLGYSDPSRTDYPTRVLAESDGEAFPKGPRDSRRTTLPTQIRRDQRAGFVDPAAHRDAPCKGRPAMPLPSHRGRTIRHGPRHGAFEGGPRDDAVEEGVDGGIIR